VANWWTRWPSVPELTDVASDLQDKGLQVYLNIDRDAASRLGVTVANITDALYDAFGQRQISTIYTQASQYRVVLQAAAANDLGPQALEQIHVKTTDGGQVQTFKPGAGSSSVRRNWPSPTWASSRR
jgi:multidrug efflux pump